MKHYSTEKHRIPILTLIEIVGIVAIIVVLTVAIVPQISKTIDKSKVTDLLVLVKTLQGSSASYYADLGTMLPLDTQNRNSVMHEDDGLSTTASLSTTLKYQQEVNQKYGKWQRFNGPYMDSFDQETPPIGVSMRLSSLYSDRILQNTVPMSERNFSLDGDAVNDIDSGSVVVALIIDGVTPDQWELVEDGYASESTMDGDVSERQARGRVKYSPDIGDGRLIIYIVHN